MNKNLRPVIHFLYLKKLKNKEIQEEINEVYGENTIGLSTVIKWTRKFKDGKENFEDEKKRGRKKIRNKTKIKKLIEGKRDISLREIGSLTNMHKNTVKRIVRDDLGLIRTNSRWIPYDLSDKQKMKRMEISIELLDILSKVPEKERKNFLTMDETWLFWKNPQNSIWQEPGNERPRKVKLNIGSKKLMLTVIWSACGIEVIDFLPRNESFNREYFSENIVEKLITEIKKRRPKRGTNGIRFHLDNARPHLIDKKFEENGIIRLPHPPYSPDLAPSDFFLFGYLKKKLEGQNFDNDDDLKKETVKILSNIEKETLKKVFDEWIRRLELCILNKGDYI